MNQFNRLLFLTIVCVISTVQGAQIPDLSNDIYDDIQYDNEPPKDIRVQCNDNEILVSVDTASNIFNGMIYPMGLSKNTSCMAEFNRNQGPVQYRLPLRSCNTMSSQLENGAIEYFNIIVVQPHRKLVTKDGRGFQVRCRYQPKDDAISHKLISSGLKGENSPALNATLLPVVSMKIYHADTNDIAIAKNVKIGDPLKIVISMDDSEEKYGLHITDCLVQDGLGWSEQHLIDGNGCPLDAEIMNEFKYNEDLSEAVVNFQAHKFPYTPSVYYQCSVHMCVQANDGCLNVPPNCSGEAKKRSRREENKKGSSSTEDGSEAMIEVYSGFYVNEVNENAANADEISEVSAKSSNDPYSICISQHSFAVGIAIAGLILMLLTVIAVLCILSKRRKPRKDVSTAGSSIYSGPYTNTAYSHTS